MEAYDAIKTGFGIQDELNKSVISIFDLIAPLFHTGIPGCPQNSPIFISGIPYSMLIGTVNVPELNPTDITVFNNIRKVILCLSESFSLNPTSSYNDTEKQIARYVIATMAANLPTFSKIVDKDRLTEYSNFFTQVAELIIVPGQDAAVKECHPQIQQISDYFEACAQSLYTPRQFTLSNELYSSLLQLSLLTQVFGLFETLTGDPTFFSPFDSNIFNLIVEIIAAPTEATLTTIKDTITKLNDYRFKLGATSFAFIRQNLIKSLTEVCQQLLEQVHPGEQQKQTPAEPQNPYQLPPETDFPINISTDILTILASFANKSQSTDSIVQTAKSIKSISKDELLNYFCDLAISSPNNAFGTLSVAGSRLPYGFNAGVSHFCTIALSYLQIAFAALEIQTDSPTQSLSTLISYSSSQENYNESVLEILSAYVVTLAAAIRCFAATLYSAASALLLENQQTLADFKILLETDQFSLNFEQFTNLVPLAKRSSELIIGLGVPEFNESGNQLKTMVSDFTEFFKGLRPIPPTLKQHYNALAIKLREIINQNDINKARIIAFALIIEITSYTRVENKYILDELTKFAASGDSKSVYKALESLLIPVKQKEVQPPKPIAIPKQITVPQAQISSQTTHQPPPSPKAPEPPKVVPQEIPQAPPPPPKEAEPAPQQIQTGKITLRVLRIVESARTALNSLIKANNEHSSEKYNQYKSSSQQLINTLLEGSDQWDKAVSSSVQDIINLSDKDYAKSAKFDNEIAMLTKVLSEIIEHFLSSFGLANSAQAEMILMNAKVDALQSEVNQMRQEEGNSSEPLRKLIIDEGLSLLKLTRVLGRCARQQADYLIMSPKTITNEQRLINSAQQTADAAQMFFLLIKSTKPGDDDLKYRVVGAAKGMNAALTSLLVNFRQISGGNPEIQQKMEITVKEIAKTMQKIIENAESTYGADINQDIQANKSTMTAHQLKVARMNASNEVLKKRRELEEAEEALKRFNRSAANKSRSNN
ncbi:hypothetical protein TVAG_129500 [Trichomonas vaginalis G3]|uniref:I/LWEQ domain-containing protein n=1 Tax=Trichomonas vaginalis (strain ATCC PRA-98 / G3) TaxID=412133 RepID=A2DI46_TRIV3|nr:I/LWEQ domain family [Trichomonas vaginalis G3]EAY19842.1 hypothetical protein TVAG_129500 [Trichomonas vaginalis G3]KAI5510030.1 I/LWEQ domain family [Trichomonas vaginalis G3]|eukprot:XP_001580828.1 hypothetical protein [Trichomonas vaginalis G3]